MNKISLSIFGILVLLVFYFSVNHVCAWSDSYSSTECSSPSATLLLSPTPGISGAPQDTISPIISQEMTLTPTSTAGASATPTQGPTATPAITPRIGTAASANNVPSQAPDTGFAPR